MNLGLVLDHSCSMHGHCLVEAEKATELLLRRLQPKDRVSLVAQDSEVTTLAEGVSGEAGRVDRVLLMTDRRANAGICEPEMLADLCRAAVPRG